LSIAHGLTLRGGHRFAHRSFAELRRGFQSFTDVRLRNFLLSRNGGRAFAGCFLCFGELLSSFRKRLSGFHRGRRRRFA
jgi:hypothetical protein